MSRSLNKNLLLPLTAHSEGAPPCNQADDHPKSLLTRILLRIKYTLYLSSILAPYWFYNLVAIEQVSTPYFFEDKELPPSVVGWTLLTLYTLHAMARTSVFYYYRLAGQENGLGSLNTFIRKIPSQMFLGSIILMAVIISIASYVVLAFGNNEESIKSISTILRQLKITSNHANTSRENPSQELSPIYIQILCYLFAVLSGNITLTNLKIILDSTDHEIRHKLAGHLMWHIKREKISYTLYFIFYISALFEISKNIALTLASLLNVEQHTGLLFVCYFIGLIPATANMAYDFFKYFMVAEYLYAKDSLILYLKQRPQLTKNLFSILWPNDDLYQGMQTSPLESDEGNFTLIFTPVRAGSLAKKIMAEITYRTRTRRIDHSELINLIQSIQDNNDNPQTKITVTELKKKTFHPQIIVKCIAALYSAITSLIVSMWITETRGGGQLYIKLISCLACIISIVNNITTFRLDREGLTKQGLLIKNSPPVHLDNDRARNSGSSLPNSNSFISSTSCSPLRQRLNPEPSVDLNFPGQQIN